MEIDRLRSCTFNVGEMIDARFKGELENWFPGIITRALGNNTYCVKYDDGDRESNVRAAHIRYRAFDKDECPGCHKSNKRETASNPILCCDGTNCEAEYHLKCAPGNLKMHPPR